MPRIEYDVVFNIDKASAKKVKELDSGGVKSSANRNRGLEKLKNNLESVNNEFSTIRLNQERAFQDLNQSMIQTIPNAQRLQKQLGLTNKQLGASNKQFASANQLVFSFSDGVQDAAQFSQGFGAGMRAIGNNISFTAELLGVTARNAKEAGVSMKTALKGAITPVTGAILGLNIALTAGQFLFDRMGKSVKEANDDLKDFISSSARLRDLGTFSFLNTNQIEDQIDALNRQKQGVDEILRLLEVSEKSTLRQFGSAFDEQLNEPVERAEKQFGFTTEEARLFREELEGSIRDLNKLQKRARLDPLGLFREQLEETTEGRLRDFNTGIVKSSELVRDQAGEIRQSILALQRGDASIMKALGIDKEDVTEAIEILQRQLSELSDFLPKKPVIPVQLPSDDIIDNTSDLLKELLQFSAIQRSIVIDVQLLQGGTPESQMEDFMTRTRDNISGSGVSGMFPVGSLAKDMNELNTLESQFASASLSIERETVAEKIRLKKKEIDSKKALMEDEATFGRKQLLALTSAAATAARGIFGNSKKGAIASAIVQGSQAIVRQYADLPFPAATATSALIAASTLKQINEIKNTEFGSSGGSVSAETGGIPQGISDRDGIPTQQITFNPRISSPMSGMVIKNEVLVDRRGLAIQTKMGEEEIRNSQKSVTTGV